MSFYSTGQVTSRLWHLFLFRYQAWFLSNQSAPLPLTSPIREPAYCTSRTGQTELNPGQISAWGNFNESKKKNVAHEQCRQVLIQAVLPCTNRIQYLSQSFKTEHNFGHPSNSDLFTSDKFEAQKLNDLFKVTLEAKLQLEQWCPNSQTKFPSTIWCF